MSAVKLNDKYTAVRKIGEGGFGEVYLYRCKKDKKEYVVKKMRVDDDELRRLADTEVKLLLEIQHPSIVAYRDCIPEQDVIYLVMEYCEGGDLSRRIKRCKKERTVFPEEQIVEWTLDLCLALQHLHSHNILHRDLKPENIFLTAQDKVKLGDFGISRQLDPGDLAKTKIGTPLYISPEVFKGRPYNNKVDIWSLGCVIYEMMALSPAVNVNALINYSSIQFNGKMPDNYSPSLTMMTRSMLSTSVLSRPDINIVLESAVLKEALSKRKASEAAAAAAAAENGKRPSPPSSASSGFSFFKRSSHVPPSPAADSNGNRSASSSSSSSSSSKAEKVTVIQVDKKQKAKEKEKEKENEKPTSRGRKSSSESAPPVTATVRAVPVGLRPESAAKLVKLTETLTTKVMEPAPKAVNVPSCFGCKVSLAGSRYILRDEKPYCIKCFESKFANHCEECKQVIGADMKDLSYKDKHWHEKCFNCVQCKTSLVGKSFACKDDKTYCPDCHDNNFALRCDACTNIFRAGMKKYEFKGKQFHEECFCCKVCRQPIGVKHFIPRDLDAVCVPCYEKHYAQFCTKCNGVINNGGITFKGTPWHRDCFTCNGCNKVLAGERFTPREEKPFCADCFAERFAKKCIRCTKPITGLGSTKFVSFEERHWHTDCFQCNRCSASLAGKGFVTKDQDVFCPDCARA